MRSSKTSSGRAGTTVVQSREVSSESSPQSKVVVLKVKAEKNVGFGEDVEDNEDKDMKTSKQCCIFKKKRKFGESSSESLSDDSTLPDDTRERRKGKREIRARGKCKHGQVESEQI